MACRCKPRDISIEGVVVEQGGQNVVKDVFKMILLDDRHRCSALGLLKAASRQKLIERYMRLSGVIPRDGQAAGQAMEIELSRTTNTCNAIFRMHQSLLSR